MSVRAKFLCQSILQAVGNANINLEPVRGGSPENETFYKFTPSGVITLQCISPEVAAQFVPGEEFYVDFTSVKEVEQAPTVKRGLYSQYQNEVVQPSATECAVLQCMSVRWDGDVESKRERDAAFNVGWIARHNGFNVVTAEGLKMLLERGLIQP